MTPVGHSPLLGPISLTERGTSIDGVRAPGASVAEPGGFADILAGAVAGAAKTERVAEDLSRRFAAGDPSVGIHEAMIGAEEASISLRYAVTLKNRLLEAYRELMSTPL